MQIWKNCTADVLFYDETPAYINDEGYIVRLSDDSIEIAYDDDEGAVCYRGENNGDGHFNLTSTERSGRASLHYFPNSHFMEGYWQEGEKPQTRGMWRIQLKN
jgi:hypothetical protein